MQPNIFYRLDTNGHAHILHEDDGSPVTRLPGTNPINSDLDGAYEHPEGVVLTEADAIALGLETDDQTTEPVA